MLLSKDHPNFRWNNNDNVVWPIQGVYNTPPGFQVPRQQAYQQALSKSLEDMLKDMALHTSTFMQETKAQFKEQGQSIKNLERQVGQLASNMQNRPPDTLPSTTVPNPKGESVAELHAMTLRSGKQLEEPIRAIEKFMNSKKEQHEKDILETFRKVQVNIPFLDAIKQVPKYAKFLKELCTNKRRYKDKETVALSEEASTVLLRKLPPKLKDPGRFTIPCTIGERRFEKALLDLGASINLMPYTVYETLKLGELKDTQVTIQLADCSIAFPKGIVEDVLVQVGELIFPADFFILEMEPEPMPYDLPPILGRPFMRTARTKIDVYEGTSTMEFDGDIICFKSFEAMRYPNDVHTCFSIDAFDYLLQDTFNASVGEDKLKSTLELGLEQNDFQLVEGDTSTGQMQGKDTNPRVSNDVVWNHEHMETVAALEAHPQVQGKPSNFISLPISDAKLVPSVIQAPKVELKPLPDHLKYAYLGDNETLPVIIASNLSAHEEVKLVRVLREHMKAIAWSIADIKGLVHPCACITFTLRRIQNLQGKLKDD
ncbi:uncharacterized protein LOC112184654 [Rosa chinensis]|uniref:uncharacterized protein LOC112184654 n=1 Tax=Rosa chinensis TaxID=74649 RepID=UPI000D093D7F|nr:uncharacterized protein LOC112184654 [Rosa chinensis]